MLLPDSWKICARLGLRTGTTCIFKRCCLLGCGNFSCGRSWWTF